MTKYTYGTMIREKANYTWLTKIFTTKLNFTLGIMSAMQHGMGNSINSVSKNIFSSKDHMAKKHQKIEFQYDKEQQLHIGFWKRKNQHDLKIRLETEPEYLDKLSSLAEATVREWPQLMERVKLAAQKELMKFKTLTINDPNEIEVEDLDVLSLTLVADEDEHFLSMGIDLPRFLDNERCLDYAEGLEEKRGSAQLGSYI